METSMSSNSNKTEHNWTNEEHLHFLKSMEASFVRTMLENNSALLRLDRYLPDSSESTLDLKSQRKKKHGTPGKNKTPSGLLAAPEILLVHQEQEWRVELIRDQQGGFHPTISIMILRKIRWSHRLISELMIKMNYKDERDLPNVAVAPPIHGSSQLMKKDSSCSGGLFSFPCYGFSPLCLLAAACCNISVALMHDLWGIAVSLLLLGLATD